MQLPSLKDAKIEGKTVFLRMDLDVPLIKEEIADDTRLKAGMETLDFLLENNAKVIIGGHLGRPKPSTSQFAVRGSEFSLEPVAERLSQISNLKTQSHNLNLKTSEIRGFAGWEITPNTFLLENLRFDPGEEKNDPVFAKKLASLADVYVNDAFAMCHRNHASIVGIAYFLPHFAGLHLEKEIENLTRTMENPQRPLVVIVGGKKIETKLPLVEKMHRIADYVLIGGKIAQEAKELVKLQHEKVSGHKSVLFVADTNQNGSDITDKDAENFLQIISLAKTIIWNGPMGIIENEKLKMKNEKLDTAAGTKKIAEGILKSGAYTVVGGGDTVEFLNKLGIIDKFSFVSTGGGAMLAFLSGEKLPGLVALEKN